MNASLRSVAYSSPSTRTVDALYAALQPQLERILNVNLQPPAWVIDDACQTAWSQLIEHRDAVEPGRELGWLATTAIRAALRLLRGWRLSAEVDSPDVVLAEIHVLESDPERRVELREQLADVRRLPSRQQHLLMLRGFGYGIDEIAEVTGSSRRTVARQLYRARQSLRTLADEG